MMWYRHGGGTVLGRALEGQAGRMEMGTRLSVNITVPLSGPSSELGLSVHLCAHRPSTS